MWNCRMYPASPNSFLCSAPESNCSYSLPLKCIWFHWTATMLCRTSRGKAGGRELEGFVAISVGVDQVLRGATELLWMQQRQMESWKCWREHRGLQSWEARMHTALHTLLAHTKVECVVCNISSVHICSLSTAQDTKEVKWVEYQRCKAWKQNHGDVVMSSLYEM